MLGVIDKIGAVAAAISGALTGTVLTAFLMSAYVWLIHDPAVASAAREGFVAMSEKLALQGQVEEMRRQFKIAEAAAANDLARARAASREAEDAWKQYETAVAADRSDDGCRVTDGDLEWLRQSRPAPVGSVN